MGILTSISWIIGISIVLFLFYAAIVSIYEKRLRAATRFGIIAFFMAAFYASCYFINAETCSYLVLTFSCAFLLIGIILVFPYSGKKLSEWETPKAKLDERVIMFSRNLLIPHTARYESYYKEYPNHEPLDLLFRSNPGLLSEASHYYNPATFAAAEANFSIIGYLGHLAAGVPAKEKKEVDPAAVTNFMKTWSEKMGVHSFGVTELQEYHKYSKVGRGDDFGMDITLNHKYAIAITTEMSHAMMDYAPYGPVVMESSEQYLNSGVVALKLATFIRSLGYEARAHIDGNYQVQVPLVAKDAGLGEFGRMGLLMTPRLGPRVRIAVVTTNIPLRTNDTFHDVRMIDFCMKCKKCAAVCPSQAISFEDPKEVDGIVRWQINQEACYTFWTKMGTDCGRCMAVCPYSHPDNALHQLVRIGLNQSALFRTMAAKMDDFFYGKKPAPKKESAWMKLR